MSQPSMAAKAALEAELRALEEQLEKKRIEEEIRQLQAQLEAVQPEDAEEEYEEIVEYIDYDQDYEEEYEEVEEYTESEVEEEIIEEEEMASPSRETTSAVAPPVAPSRSTTTRVASNKPIAAAGEGAPTSKPRFVTRVKKQNAFTRNMEAKAAAAARAEREKAEAAVKAHPKHRGGAVQVVQKSKEQGPLPDLPPFTARVIPKTPPSAAGDETNMEILLGPKLYKGGKCISCSTNAGVEDQELVMLYFAAYWNSDCKPFFALLDDFYKIVSKEAKLEVIYISCDRSLQHFKEAFVKLPYLAMPPGTSPLKNTLARALQLVDMPSLVVMNPQTGHIITTKAVEQIENLDRRNIDQCKALVAQWKATKPIPISEVQHDKRFVNGDMERGFLYWQ